MKRHYDLNQLGMAVVKPGGLLLSCCCAGLVTDDDFRAMLKSASRRTLPFDRDDSTGSTRMTRDIRLLDVTGAACDHPTSLDFPESRYLKAYWLTVV
jgi:23S rRNA (cytosine1962-C5)-methyltransferase